MSKGFLIDTTRCIACKGCQVACKQWNNLPAEKTENKGSLQNPPDFSFTTYKLVRMNEEMIEGKVKLLYFPDQCRHCLIPSCLLWAQDRDAIYQDEDTGADHAARAETEVPVVFIAVSDVDKSRIGVADISGAAIVAHGAPGGKKNKVV